ncbi:luciferin 4-monooxygenase-like [Battus philenor]|uniref:luciferin 4-monooxygenase-like n=1 Tax=Battus philenor TaxID=42288 RepID=UPI0035CF5528
MLKNSKYLYGPEEILVPVQFNLGNFLVKKLMKHGDTAAFTNAVTEELLTYKDIAQTAMNIAMSLTKIGVKKGDVVGVCSENRLENWPTLIGVVSIGAVLTPISILYVKDELRHILNISKPKYLFCSKKAVENHWSLFKSLDYVKKIILFDYEDQSDVLFYKDLAIASSNSIIKENVQFDQFQAVEVDYSHTAIIMYSSGTTGLSKGVMLSHLNVIVTCCLPNLSEAKMRILAVIPWYHVMGLMLNLCYITSKATVIFFAKFEADLYLRAIEKYKINYLVLVPAVLLALYKTPFKHDVSTVEIIFCGSAVLRKEITEDVKTKFKNLKDIFQGYGMTEATMIIALNSHINGMKCKLGSVGKVVENTILKIVDIETRKPLGPYQKGEICFKSPTLMNGYLGTENINDFDEEGFFKSGDIGYYDDEEYLYVVDRLKELIKYKGYQVPPAEIETVLAQHSGVRDVGVVGLPHSTAGEVPLAFVVLQPGAIVTESELQQYVAERLSNPKHLRGGVRFVTAIPRNQNGKILRKTLREMIKANEEM